MNREQAAQIIKGNIEDYLQSKGIDTSKPFKCLNPGHQDHNPSMSLDRERNKAHCFSCGADYSTLDLIGIDYNLTEYNAMLSKGAELYHLDIDQSPSEPRANEQRTNREKSQVSEAEPNYTAFYSEAAKNLSKTDYHTKRGISQKTAEYFKLGYVEQWRHPKAQTMLPSPRLIIPIGKGCYLARDTRPNPPKGKNNKDYAKSKVGSPVLFNEQALRTATEPIFVTEGELDAMSIYEAGGIAVALGSTSYKRKLCEALEKCPTKQPLILTLDNDRAGELCSKELFITLKEKGFNICELNVQKPYKDANEALVKDRARLIEKVSQAKEIAETSTDLAQQIQYEQQNQASSYIDTMRAELEKEMEQPGISTGFKNLDGIINGGLYPGLYFIGAISSLGKTTLALQIADNVAKQGQDVLIISLEMAKRELIAKSISRETAEYSLQAKGNVKALGQTTADIMNLKRQQGYYDDAGQWVDFREEIKRDIAAVVDIAYKRYSEYAGHIFIYEGIGDITTEAIKSRIDEHRAIYGKAPVLIVDYLQILQGDSDRLSDKQKVDKGVVELKRISRDYKTPVIAISSVNRQSYSEPISMESFKESGGIEFSSDILIGLQYKGMDYNDENGKREKESERLSRIAALNKEMREIAGQGLPQPIEVKILKNRNGRRRDIELLFYPMYNLFQERAKAGEQPKQNRRV